MQKNSKLPFPFVFALDGPWGQCSKWVERLKDKVWGFKVGSILYADKGPSIVHELKNAGTNVFLDLKFHDIPNTVSHAVKQSFHSGADWLTVHVSGGAEMIKAAAEHQTENKKVFGVSVLTSFDQQNLKSIGVSNSLENQVELLVGLGADSGLSSFVCSPHEVGRLKKLQPSATFLTPGVRLDNSHGDQKRVATISEALSWGANYAVLGRALSEATDWEKTWESIKLSMAETS